jgi:hypothetical protein
VSTIFNTLESVVLTRVDGRRSSVGASYDDGPESLAARTRDTLWMIASAAALGRATGTNRLPSTRAWGSRVLFG